MLQHGSYTLLIDACYDREKFPTLEDAIEWTWASTTEEIEAVQFVLKKFFTLENGVYVQNHIKEDLEKYSENAEINKRIAIERETKRKENSTKRAQNVHEAPPNHKPLTKNQEPLTKKDITPEGDLFLGVQEQIVKDFKALRITHRAKVTKTAIDGIKREALKAGVSFEDALRICCERGWRGFKAEWLLPKENGINAPPAFIAKPILPVDQQVPVLANLPRKTETGMELAAQARQALKKVV